MKHIAHRTSMNDKQVDFVLLGEIAFVRRGLATGNNDEYFFRDTTINASYKIVNQQSILNENEISLIQNNEELRLQIINNGISEHLFNGKTVIPLDKGATSDIEGGLLSNYYKKTAHYVDWSESSVHKLKIMTVNDWKDLNKKDNMNKHEESKIASRFQNKEYYFINGITISSFGLYAPTFRLGSGTVFDQSGNSIFIKKQFSNLFNLEFLLGVLCSKFMRYVQKSFINNSINVLVDDVKTYPIPISDSGKRTIITRLVKSIIEKQKLNPNYEYQNNEQIEIDENIFELFGLTNNQILEVQNWYSRKYPKLVLND